MNTKYKLLASFLLAISVFFSIGCVKSDFTKKTGIHLENNNDIPSSIIKNDSLVLTPFGYMNKKNVFHLEPGYELKEEKGDLLLVNKISKKVERKLAHLTINNRLSRFPNNIIPVNDGWITYGYWSNNAQNNPINRFTTNWIVPNNPTTNHGQTIFIFNGIQDGLLTTSHILQPVLQWGTSAAGGGNYWSIANWYVTGNNAIFGNLVQVPSGINLQGIMQETAQNGTQFSYTSSFTGYPTANSINVNNVTQLYWSCETLETYGVQYDSDDPANDFVAMNDIQILLNSGNNAQLNWTPQNVVTNFGQHTIIVSNNSPNGEVDLYFRNPPPPLPNINGQGSVTLYKSTGDENGTIVGSPNSTIYVTVSAYGPTSSSPLTNFSLGGEATLSGPMGNDLYVQNGSTTQSFTMPLSGYISWSGFYTSSDGQGVGSISVNY
ncbi:MAG: hypothetical protein IT214_12470 [Chitinophagaceae bacterium]|nr:hypothetical protein [Chitinophagaceae bacterium]